MTPRLSRAGGEALSSESSSGDDFWDYSSSYSDGNHLQPQQQASVRRIMWRRRGSMLRNRRGSHEEHNNRSRSYTTGDISEPSESLRPSSPPPLLQASSSTLDDLQAFRSRTESSEHTTDSEHSCDAIFVTKTTLQRNNNTIDSHVRILARRATVVARHRSQQALRFCFYALLDVVFFLFSTAFTIVEFFALFVRNNIVLRWMGRGFVCVAAHFVRCCGLSPKPKPEPRKTSTPPPTTCERSPRWRLRRSVQAGEAKRRKLLRLRRERVDCLD